jgi:hypothetical protein
MHKLSPRGTNVAISCVPEQDFSQKPQITVGNKTGKGSSVRLGRRQYLAHYECPTWIRNDSRLTGSNRTSIAALVGFLTRQAGRPVTMAQGPLADAVGVHPATLRKAARLAEQLGFIEIEPGWRCATYRIARQRTAA